MGGVNAGFYLRKCHKLLQALEIRKFNRFFQLLSRFFLKRHFISAFRAQPAQARAFSATVLLHCTRQTQLIDHRVLGPGLRQLILGEVGDWSPSFIMKSMQGSLDPTMPFGYF